jgi:alpha-beta hydrolase superfamily lysophospholipase
MMKKDSADAFFDGNAGDFLLRTLENYENPPRVFLVGHSAGATFVCNLLRNATSGAFDVALLAPAVSYKYFNETV